MLELFSGRCRWRWLTVTTKGLFSQNCLTSKCQSFKVDPAASRYFCEQVASTLANIPIFHWLIIGWRLFNDWLRISIYRIIRISAHFTRWAHIQWRLSYIAIYLKIWRLSLQNISRWGPALKTRFLAGVHIWNVKYNFNGMFYTVSPQALRTAFD